MYAFVGLRIAGSQLGKIARMMLEPFSVLEHLQISLEYGIAPVLLGVFLDRNTFSDVLYLTLPPFVCQQLRRT